MKTTALYLQSLADTKQAIKQALVNKGQEPSLVFASYSLLILRIETGSDVDLSFVNASSSLILAGFTGADAEGNPVYGDIQHKYSSDIELNPEGSINIIKGYYLNTEVTLPLTTTTVDSNLVTTTIGWSKGKTITVGTLIEGGLINPDTTDQTIAKNSFLASAIVIKGLQNFLLLNIALGVTMWGKTGTHKSSADLSFITATADKILSGFVGSDSSGNPVNGAIANGVISDSPVANVKVVGAGYYAQDTEITIGLAVYSSVYVPTTTLITIPDNSFMIGCTIAGDSNLVALNIKKDVSIFGVSGSYLGSSTDLSFITAQYYHILQGFVGSDANGNPVNGVIPTIQGGIYYPSTEPIVFYGGSYLGDMLQIPGLVNLLPLNIKSGVYIYNVQGTYLGAVDTEKVGVLVEGTDGALMFQELAFDGTTPTDSGDPVAIEGTYLYNTGKDEPDYSGGGGGGSTEFYKCAAVHEASEGDGYIVEGAGTAEANGTYTFSESTGNSYDVYTNENGCRLWEMHHMETGVTTSFELHGTSNNVCYYIFFVSNEVIQSGNVIEGQEPVPTVQKAEPSEASWDGYKYDLETKEFADTLTEGLSYTSAVAPTVGKVYTADGSIECDVYTQDGLVFYTPLKKESIVDELGNQLDNSSVIFGAYGLNVPVFTPTGSSQCIKFDPSIIQTDTFSIMSFARMDVDNCGIYGNVFAFGNWGGNSTQLSICRDNSVVAMNAWLDGNVITFLSELDNEWHHYALTYSSGTLIGYLDGAQIAQVSWSPNFDMQYAAIGSWDGFTSANRQWNGGISEAKLYSRVLSAEEIAAEADRCLAMVTE